MDIQAELKHMSDEIFHEELSKKMLDASLQEMEEDAFLIPEDEYNEGVAELTKIFRDDQRAKFDQMEELCKQNIMYLIKFAFGRGLYTALEQYFVEQSQEEPFRKLVEEQILQYPEMTQYSEYFDRREQIHGLYRQLKAELNERRARRRIRRRFLFPFAGASLADAVREWNERGKERLRSFRDRTKGGKKKGGSDEPNETNEKGE